jgi:di/tricarboxylate transporter
MTGQILLTLAIACGAVVLFVWGRFRMDVVGLMVMTALIVSRVLTPREGISGFANEATVTVAAMFVLSAGLVRTGAIDTLGQWVARLGGQSELRLLLVSMALVIPLSAFLNNTPVVVVMVPLVLGISRKIGVRASRLLMPISFASQMGGTLTLIGTSTNLLVAGLVLELGMDRIGLFDITPPALILTFLGVVYLVTIGRRLTPERKPSDQDLFARYELRDYLTGLEIEPDSSLADRTLRESRFGSTHGLAVVAIERAEGRIFRPGADTLLRVGDVLIASGSAADIAKVEEAAGVRIAPPEPGFPGSAPGGKESDPEPVRLAELMVPPRSAAEGRTLRELHFRTRYRLQVLGIRRHGQALHERMRDIRLRPGDLLLVQGTTEELSSIHAHRDLALLGVVDPPSRRRRKLGIAVGILAGVVLLAAFDLLPILVSALLGVIAMFITRCVTPEEAIEEVDWMVIVLLGSILPLGLAMQKTGAAQLIADALLQVTAPLGLIGMLAAFYLMTSLLTEIISNNATAVVLVPIAVATATGLGVSPLPFVIAVMIAASNSYMTPIGYQTNTFVYGPGGYRFVDFVKVGGPLNLLMMAAAAVVIPWFFPF